MTKYFEVVLLDENDMPVECGAPLAKVASYADAVARIHAYFRMPDFLTFIDPRYSFGIIECEQTLVLTYRLNSPV